MLEKPPIKHVGKSFIEPARRMTVAKKSKKAKRGASRRKKSKKRMKKATSQKKKSEMKNAASTPTPIPLAPAPLLGSFGVKTEDQ
jgi:hypothetical protein